jgi:hypothetical protein
VNQIINSAWHGLSWKCRRLPAGETQLTTNGKKNGLMSYEQLHELLQMTALQTSENAKQLRASRKEHDREMKEIRAEHKRGMREIRESLNKLIKRIAS